MTDDRATPTRYSDANLGAGGAWQPEALRELYNRYFGAAYALAVRIVADEAWAEACVHEVFLAFWQKPHVVDRATDPVFMGLMTAVYRAARARRRAIARKAVCPPVVPIRTNMETGSPPAQSRRAVPHRDEPLARAALSDETNPEYRSTVRPAPVREEVNGTEAATIDSGAEHRLDERQNELLLTLGHELKTPITVIKGTVQLAHHRLRAAGHVQEAGWLEVANSQIDRLTALVDYLLRAGQLDGSEVRLDLARFNLAALVREVALTLQALSDVHVVTVEAPEDVEMEGDVDRLRQVVSNLINNAIKYSPAGGNVEVTLRRTGSDVSFCVRDYGIGIPVEERERVFERFERASNVGLIPGFGLGLTMCRDIIHAHHGRLWVGSLSEEAAAAAITSGPPPAGDARGSLFCLALPVSQGLRR